MGLSKTIITKQRIKYIFESKGYEGLVSFIEKNDIIFISDKISQKIIKLIESTENKEVVVSLIKKIKQKN
jgi:hypothetical protein